MEYAIKDIAAIVHAEGQLVRPDATVDTLITDSRNIISGGKGLFFAISGKHHDGHRFIARVYAAGVRNFVVERLLEYGFGDANFLLVENSVEAMQQIAAYHRTQFHYPVIGITGSNGKTIVKEWLYHLLKVFEDIVRSPKSYNSQTGVPLSVWQMDTRNTLGIFEAGISQTGEMEKLQNVIRPDIGIFTNIGQAHSEGFAGDAEKVREKMLLFSGSKLLIYCRDHVLIAAHIPEALHTLSWSMLEDPAADVLVEDIEYLPGETLFILRMQGEAYHFRIPFSDAGSLENAVHALLAAMAVEGLTENRDDAKMEKLVEQAAAFPPVSMRLELKKGINNCLLIDDAYSADIRSLEIALNFLNHQAGNSEKTVILGDFAESREAEAQFYARIAELLRSADIKRLSGIGPAMRRQSEMFSFAQAQYFDSAEDFLAKFREEDFANAIILVKGARRIGLEAISARLALKTHGTVLRIYLHHLVHNLHVYRSLMKPETKIMVMVKAFSYGSGQAEIARILAHNRVDYLAVAYADEGLELRRQGIRTPVLVMNPEPDTFGQMVQAGLEPEIYSFRILKAFADHLRGNTASPAVKPFAIHIKFDTGMHRLGFEEKDIQQLIQTLQSFPFLQVASVFTHLAASDEREEDAFTREQIGRFERMAGMLQSAFPHPILRHVLNTSGISNFPGAQMDMVRLGIGLYGVDSSVHTRDRLMYVSSLETTISQVRSVDAGESIGYGRSHKAAAPMRIATINIGYADGFSRMLSNGRGLVYLHGKRAPVAGRVCMDMAMIDISDIPEAKEGDPVEIFGEHIAITEHAGWRGTIAYEVMTGISQRVKRIYLQE